MIAGRDPAMERLDTQFEAVASALAQVLAVAKNEMEQYGVDPGQSTASAFPGARFRLAEALRTLERLGGPHLAACVKLASQDVLFPSLPAVESEVQAGYEEIRAERE